MEQSSAKQCSFHDNKDWCLTCRFTFSSHLVPCQNLALCFINARSLFVALKALVSQPLSLIYCFVIVFQFHQSSFFYEFPTLLNAWNKFEIRFPTALSTLISSKQPSLHVFSPFLGVVALSSR